MLGEVSAESLQCARGFFMDACALPRGNLRITYTTALRKNVSYL